MGFFDEFFDDDKKKHNQEKEALMQLSEKELLVEILIELRKMNNTTEDIYRFQVLSG